MSSDFFDNKIEIFQPGEALLQFVELEKILINENENNFLSFAAVLDKENSLKSFNSEISRILGRSIRVDSNWINFLRASDVDNNFGWHVDDKYPGTHVGIYWVMGEEHSGGDLLVLKPGFDHDNVSDNEMFRIQFKMGQLTIFPIELYHKVEHYFGTIPRISLNFTFSLK